MSNFPFYFLNNYIFFIVFLFWHSFLNAGDDVFFDSLPSGKIFYKADKKYDNFQLVSGSVRYLRTDEGAEGYKAEEVFQFETYGSVRIFDHEPGVSAVKYYRDAELALEKRGFHTLYRCDSVQCGDISGWQLYLSEKLLGDEATQHYVLAKSSSGDGVSYYAQFYVVELDDQVRSFQRLIGPISYEFSSGNTNLENSDVTLFFLYDSTQLVGDSQRRLVDFLNTVDVSGVSKVIVTGYTDSLGDSAYNKSLALRRANYIARKLKSRAVFGHLEIQVSAKGESAPVEDNRTASGREKNRRATIQLIM